MVYETTSSRVGVPEKKTFSLSRERETKSCRMDMQQKCCNSTRRSLPASPDTIRYYLYTFHPPPDRPTDQRTASRCPKRKSPRSDIIIIIHIAITQRTNARSTSCISTSYLTFSPSDTRPTLPHLILPTFLGSHPKKKTSSLIHPSIHPSEKTGPVIISFRTISKSSEILPTLRKL